MYATAPSKGAYAYGNSYTTALPAVMDKEELSRTTYPVTYPLERPTAHCCERDVYCEVCYVKRWLVGISILSVMAVGTTFLFVVYAALYARAGSDPTCRLTYHDPAYQAARVEPHDAVAAQPANADAIIAAAAAEQGYCDPGLASTQIVNLRFDTCLRSSSDGLCYNAVACNANRTLHCVLDASCKTDCAAYPTAYYNRTEELVKNHRCGFSIYAQRCAAGCVVMRMADRPDASRGMLFTINAPIVDASASDWETACDNGKPIPLWAAEQRIVSMQHIYFNKWAPGYAPYRSYTSLVPCTVPEGLPEGPYYNS